MGRHVLIELAHLAGGVALALAISWAAAWAYPLGAAVIWAYGGAAAVATVILAAGPIRDAWRRDRASAR